MPRTRGSFELVVNGEVCEVEVKTEKERGKQPVYGVWFRGERVGEVWRVKQNFWKAIHHDTGMTFEGRVRQRCVTTMITQIYKE